MAMSDVSFSVLDFVKFYTIEFFYKDGSINFIGIILAFVIIFWIVSRVKLHKKNKEYGGTVEGNNVNYKIN